MANLFAFRTTNPQELYSDKNSVGSENDYYIKKFAKKSEKIIACWGNHGRFNNRSQIVYELVDSLHCLDTNKCGEPKHPLYIRSDAKPKPYISFYHYKLVCGKMSIGHLC